LHGESNDLRQRGESELDGASTLDSLGTRAWGPTDRHPLADEPNLMPVVDWKVAQDYAQGDEHFLRALVDAFCEEGPELLRQLRHALRTGDAALMQRAGHTLKGSLQYFGADATAALARQLERLGREGSTASATSVLDLLERQLECMLATLESFRTSGRIPESLASESPHED
jgi:HPt (histidine-containing phosphotransfer) domain-containing protein